MFKAVRCNNKKPTPYLRKYFHSFQLCKDDLILDLGCGNLRNTKYMESFDFFNVLPIDKARDYGYQVDLGSEKIPGNFCSGKAKLILCNYVMCFLNNKERVHLSKEINRVSEKGTYLMVEMYEAKLGIPYDMDMIRGMFESWDLIHQEKNRFIVK